MTQLKSHVLPDGTLVTFTYDALGRRTSKTAGSQTTHYLWDGDELLAELDPQGHLLKSYAHGIEIDEVLYQEDYTRQETLFFHQDHLESTLALTDSQGIVKESYSYDPYGNLIQSPSSPSTHFLYTGRELDQETHLYYNRARYYDPSLGRFISPDPKGYEAGLNLYRYVHNNPLTYRDPQGMDEYWGGCGGYKGYFNSAKNAISIAVSSAAHAVASAVSSFTTSFASAISYAASTLASAVSSVVNAVTSALTSPPPPTQEKTVNLYDPKTGNFDKVPLKDAPMETLPSEYEKSPQKNDSFVEWVKNFLNDSQKIESAAKTAGNVAVLIAGNNPVPLVKEGLNLLLDKTFPNIPQSPLINTMRNGSVSSRDVADLVDWRVRQPGGIGEFVTSGAIGAIVAATTEEILHFKSNG